MLINIVFDHPDFVIIDKPVDVAVQDEATQTGILPIVCQQLNLKKLWLVHRLDKVTSGILILAKNAQAAAVFGSLFADKKIEKYYLAIATKKPKKKQGTIRGGMTKVRDGKWMLTSKSENVAKTQFFSFGLLPNIRLFLLKPLTGKTHQLRVALKSLSSPILGDRLYTGEPAERTYLHAYGIKFQYKDQSIELTCLPSVGEHFLSHACLEFCQKLSAPWQQLWPNS
ncbi:TIGR01621 family pseudouridine synthase [Paraglaciecola sp. L3A3]|uniref:TIGR01621 family pseudouridine synthase n=1 Tax=Paraglaciecola sp. L3A3 TaxID=2686358 RepID=UPI00131EC544|nr:TIGR01621 family pseudouridine synthase [Paraglaciecola sp. L3A3]